MRLSKTIAIGTLLLLWGCGDRSGLDFGGPDDAGQAGGTGGAGGTTGGAGGTTGGAGGAIGGAGGGTAGSGGTAGTGGKGGAGGSLGQDAGPVCGPVCAIYCPYGNVPDEKGCPTCQCKPAPTCAVPTCMKCEHGYAKDANGCQTCQCLPPPKCQPVTCKIACRYGFARDKNGCETCECAPPPVCPAIACPPVACPYGYRKDANGCTTCECNPQPACADSECGAAPRLACSDGSAPKLSCQRDASGRCGWNSTCPADCSQATDSASCAKLSHCSWLTPGCVEPKLPAAGCYPKASLDCGTRACPVGKTCLKRTVNPCPSSAGAAPAPGLVPPPRDGGVAMDPIAPAPTTCSACGQTIAICL